MYNLEYLNDLRNHKEINCNNILLHLAENRYKSAKDKINLISLIHNIQSKPAVIIVGKDDLKEWEEELDESGQLFDRLPEITSDLSDQNNYEEVYLDTDFEVTAPFVFSFTDTQKPEIPNLELFYDRIAEGDWSEEAASEYARAYEELARISGSLDRPYKKMYAKACRILGKDEIFFNLLPNYRPTTLEMCQDIAEQTGFEHPELLMNIASLIPDVMDSLTKSGDLLDPSYYPSKLLWIYHFDEIFDQSVTMSGALRLLALEDKYEEVKKAFKEKYISV